jgi:hypothetical protein
VTAALQYRKDQEIIGSFNKGLEIIEANGIYDRIFRKYDLEKDPALGVNSLARNEACVCTQAVADAN